MPHMRAEVRIFAQDQAGLLVSALEPEMDHEVSRATVEIEADGNELVIRVEAEDMVALRAAVNSYLRWAKLATDMIAIPSE